MPSPLSLSDEQKSAYVKEQMPVTRDKVYLNTGTAGPLGKAAQQALQRGMEADFQVGRGTISAFVPLLEAIQEGRQALARLVKASPEEIALTHNTTEGINIVAHGLRWQPGDEIITTTHEHEGGLIPLYVLKQRYGVMIHVVDLAMEDGPEQVLEKLAARINQRTRLLLFSHVAWNSGLRFPLEELAALARQHDVLTLVDAAQSAGAIPLDLPQSGVDFYAMPGQKWLCGPEGTGALYVRRDRLDVLSPTFAGILSLRDFHAYDFSGHFIPAPGASRFETSSVYRPGILAMRDNLHWLEQTVGWDWIYRRIAANFDYAYQQLQRVPGMVLLTQPGPQAGLISFYLDGYDSGRVMARLEQEGIVVRTIPYPFCLRLSTGFYNDREDIDKLVTILQQIAAADPEDLPPYELPF